MKKFYLTAIILFLASCTSLNQKPAPYEVYGTQYYGKATPQSAANHPVYNNNDALDSSSPNYNSEIDAENSTRNAAHPVGGNQPSRLQSSAATSSNGISARPLGEAPAIDGDEQVVKLNAGKAPAYSSSTVTAYNFQNGNGAAREETVPPVENTDNYVNPAEENKQRNADEKLSHLKPLPKPPYVAAAAQTKVTSKVTKVVTSSGAVPSSTIGVANNSQIGNATETSDEGEEAAALVKTPVQATTPQQAAQPAPTTQETIPPVEQVVPETAVAEAAPPMETSSAAKPKSQFIKPVDGTVVADFGGDNAGGGFNDGINIQAPEGTPVKASANGTVVYAGNQLQGYGNMVIVKHSDGFLTAYSHLKGLEVKKGDQVAQGDVIGHVGKTGNVSSPQLHFGIRKGREPVDPKDYL